jgi:hypothetical protein
MNPPEKKANKATSANSAKGMSPLAAMIAEAGDVSAGRLKQQIKYKWLYYPVIEGGETWVKFTRAEMCRWTGLSRHQYDRAIRILKKKKLIVAKYRHANGKMHTFARLLEGPDNTPDNTQEVPKVLSAGPDNMMSAGADNTLELSNGKTKNLPLYKKEILKEKPIGEAKPGEKPAGEEIEQLIAHSKSPVDVEAIWKRTLKEHHPCNHHQIWSPTRLQELKALAGDLAWPILAGAAHDAVKRWAELTHYLQANHGAYKMPLVPAAWVFTKYFGGCVEFAAAMAAEVSSGAKTLKIAPTASPVVETPKFPGNADKASLDEVLKAFEKN